MPYNARYHPSNTNYLDYLLELNFCSEALNLPANRKYVLIIMALHETVEENLCFLSISALVSISGLVKSTIHEILADLIKIGFITVLDSSHIPPRYFKKSNQNCYRLNIIDVDNITKPQV